LSAAFDVDVAVDFDSRWLSIIGKGKKQRQKAKAKSKSKSKSKSNSKATDKSVRPTLGSLGGGSIRRACGEMHEFGNLGSHFPGADSTLARSCQIPCAEASLQR
jgi:hypothetical protein